MFQAVVKARMKLIRFEFSKEAVGKTGQALRPPPNPGASALIRFSRCSIVCEVKGGAAMMTADEVLKAFQMLPAEERRLLKARIIDNDIPQLSEAELEKAYDDLLALSGGVNTGTVLVPVPDREQLYDENW